MTRSRNNDAHPGFTLIELMLVITIIAILGGIAVPMYRAHVRYTKETTLKSDLRSLREVIDQYTADKKKEPQALKDLVGAGYLREVPVDPFTNSNLTWQLIMDTTGEQEAGGIINVHSGSTALSTEGAAYSSW